MHILNIFAFLRPTSVFVNNYKVIYKTTKFLLDNLLYKAIQFHYKEEIFNEGEKKKLTITCWLS